MINNIKEISKKLNSKFYFDYDMSNNVWFKSGGKTLIYCQAYNIEELKIMLNEIKDLPFEVIGAGSNILVRDNGFDGIIIKLGKEFNKIKIHDTFVEVGAGILDVNLAKFAERKNIKNFEFYSGIPGTIGGAIKMNAGCYGFETKDIIKEVCVIDLKGNLKKYKKENINFAYRDSNLPLNSIIVSARYNCLYGNKDEITKKTILIKEMRETSQPLKLRTSGSTFKNPKNNYAAKLIELSNCKGLNVGDAYVSEKHANFFINKNKATASQIEELGSIVIDRVYNKFNIKLEWEIKLIGK